MGWFNHQLDNISLPCGFPLLVSLSLVNWGDFSNCAESMVTNISIFWASKKKKGQAVQKPGQNPGPPKTQKNQITIFLPQKKPTVFGALGLEPCVVPNHPSAHHCFWQPENLITCFPGGKQPTIGLQRWVRTTKEGNKPARNWRWQRQIFVRIFLGAKNKSSLEWRGQKLNLHLIVPDFWWRAGC